MRPRVLPSSSIAFRVRFHKRFGTPSAILFDKQVGPHHEWFLELLELSWWTNSPKGCAALGQRWKLNGAALPSLTLGPILQDRRNHWRCQLRTHRQGLYAVVFACFRPVGCVAKSSPLLKRESDARCLNSAACRCFEKAVCELKLDLRRIWP